FDGVGRGEALVERLAVAKIAHLDLHEGAEVAGRAVLGFHDEVRFTIVFDDLTFADVVGCGHVSDVGFELRKGQELRNAPREVKLRGVGPAPAGNWCISNLSFPATSEDCAPITHET